MTSNPGFSTVRNLADEGASIQEQSMARKFLILFKSLPNILNQLFFADEFDQENQLAIEIKFKNFVQILEDRDRAIKQGFLSNPRTVPCSINYKGSIIKCNVRLKGDLGDHWFASTRMSLRFSLKGGSIDGMRKFSIQKPRARQYPYEHAFQKQIRALGNLGAKHTFKNIILNGKNWGVMDVEELISKDFLEREKKKNSLIYRFSDDRNWLNYSKGKKNYYPNYYLSDSRIEHSLVGNDLKQFNSTDARKFSSLLVDCLITNCSEEIFDQEKFLNSLILAIAWGNLHTLSDHNSRYYLNPFTIKLEPITSDQGIWRELNHSYLRELISTSSIPLIYKKFLNDSKLIKSDIKKILSKIKFNSANVIDNLNSSRVFFPLDIKKSRNLLNQNVDFLVNNLDYLYELLTNVNKRDLQNISSNSSISTQQILDLEDFAKIIHYENGDVFVFNLTGEKIIIRDFGLETDNHELKNNPKNLNYTIPASSNNKLSYKKIKTKYTGIRDNKIFVNISLDSILKKHQNQFTLIKYKPSSSKKMSCLLETCSLDGEYIFDKSVYFDKKINIKQGSVLKLTNGANLYFQNGVIFSGTKNKNINIEGNGAEAIFVNNEKNRSIFSWVNFYNLGQFTDEKLKLTGALTVYSGETKLENIIMENTTAEDFLNIYSSNIDIKNIKVSQTKSDGFDCDFCSGKIRDISFDKIGGDGLDVSGSDILISNFQAKNVFDKAISVGEQSNIDIDNVLVSESGHGVVSKDGSKTNIDNFRLFDNDSFDFMTYDKKIIYDSKTKLIAKTNYQENISYKISCQIGTFLTLNGKKCLGKEIDTKKLYETGRMLKK